MGSPFTPKTLSFLRAPKRTNDREWFLHGGEADSTKGGGTAGARPAPMW